MKIPFLLRVAALVPALPVIAGLTRHRQITGARLTIIGWCLLLLFMDLIAGYIGQVRHMNNHFLSFVFTPIQGATMMWALSQWQVKPVARMTIRLAIPPFLVAWVLLTVLLEDSTNFSAYAEPVYSLLALGAALYTILARSSVETGALPGQDWFWICAGLVLYFGALAVLTPLGAAFVATDPMLVYRAYMVRGWVNILAFLFITAGMLCPPPAPSGHFS